MINWKLNKDEGGGGPEDHQTKDKRGCETVGYDWDMHCRSELDYRTTLGDWTVGKQRDI